MWVNWGVLGVKGVGVNRGEGGGGKLGGAGGKGVGVNGGEGGGGK